MSAIATTLESIVGADAVHGPEQIDASLRGAIARAMVPQSNISAVVYPSTVDQLAAVMTCAHQNRWRVLPCGHGSKLNWGGLVKDVDVVISTARLNRLSQHAVGDLTVTAEAGMPFAELQAVLQAENQFLALDPAYANAATLGGIVATADAGSWRQRYGGVRDMLIGITLVRHDGQVVKAGGKVVKNVAGYDLMKLMTGSYGTLGVISELTFRTYPGQGASQTVIMMGEIEAIAPLAAALRGSVLTPTMMDWLSPGVMQAARLGNTTGLAVRFQSTAESVEEQAARLLKLAEAKHLTTKQFTHDAETQFWQTVQTQLWPSEQSSERPNPITCKIGILPGASAALLQDIEQLTQEGVAYAARIHAGSGVGVLHFPTIDGAKTLIENVRSRCEADQGYLTLLEAPTELKQTLDVWGYPGNALELMRQIKAQFDPDQRLSPNRFVGGL